MDLTGILRERYGVLHTDIDVEPHDGGMNSRTWWVSVDDVRCYVAKWVPDAVVGSLAAGVEAASLAERSGVVTGAAVEAVGGDRVLLVEGGSLVLMHHVEGAALTDDEEQTVVGETLARVHAATAGHDLALGLRWPWVDPHGAHLDDHPDLRDGVADALATMEALPALISGVAHGDPAPDAFLRLDDGRVALIDWAGALVAPLLYDVASAAMYLGGLEQAEPMLAAYADAGGPATPDLPHAGAMLHFRWAVQADYFARRLATGDLTGTDVAGNRKGLEDARSALRAP